MNIYMGIGVGAQVALQFHKLRKSFPHLFCSRLVNKVWYSQVGGVEILRNSCAEMWKVCTLVCDGVDIPLPPGTQGIIILNVSSYGGGANLWGRSAASSPALHNPWASRSSVLGHSSSSHGSTSPPSASHGTGEDDEWLPITQPDEFVVPSYNDGVLEIVAVTGSLHLAKTQVGLANARRLVQCRRISIRTTKDLPMQIDGEPVLQPPSSINVRFHNQAVVLRRSVRQTGRVAARLAEVLDWGQANSVITAEQRTILLRELADRSQGIAS